MMALRTLDSSAGTLLQYLETVAAMPEAHSDPLVLAVIRALGRWDLDCDACMGPSSRSHCPKGLTLLI